MYFIQCTKIYSHETSVAGRQDMHLFCQGYSNRHEKNPELSDMRPTCASLSAAKAKDSLADLNLYAGSHAIP